LALRLDAETVPNQKEFMDAVWGAVVKLFGEVGASLTGLALVDYDLEKKLAVVRTSLVALDMVRAALASITCVGGREMAVHVLAVSGTIRSLYDKV
jgi:RNase P/RNase MRP subunit POP5